MRRFLTIVALIFFGSFAWGVEAFHEGGPKIPISKDCSGAHCTIVDYWWAFIETNLVRNGVSSTLVTDLHASLFMDVLLQAPAQGYSPQCGAGATLSIPIRASGEIIGGGRGTYALYDTPPIRFLPDGRFQAITDGFERACEVIVGSGDESLVGGSAYQTALQQCNDALSQPIDGRWTDTWTVSGVTGGGITCSSNAAGTVGTCAIAPGTTGDDVTVKLSRGIDGLTWRHRNTISQLTRNGDIFPARMESTTAINCGAASLPNLQVTAAALSNPTAPKAGDSLSVSAGVTNAGVAAASASVTRLRFDTNADGSWDAGPFDVNTAALTPDTTTPAAWSNAWSAPAGTHRLQACADATSVVAESDENDNCRTVVFTVMGGGSTPPPPPTSALCAPVAQTALVDQDVTFQYVPEGTTHWSAPNGTPSASPAGGAREFKTRYSAPGTYTVTASPNYFYDVDGDGYVSENDVILVRDKKLGLRVPTPPTLDAAWQNQNNPFDVNNDGDVTSHDALEIINYLNRYAGSTTRILPQTTCTVTVSPRQAADTGPTASFDVPPVVRLNDRITATSTSQVGTCPGRVCNTLTYNWQVTRVSDNADATPSIKNEAIASIVGDQLTQYRFVLTITDNLGRQSTATKVVQVISTPVTRPTGLHSLCTPVHQRVAFGSTITLDFSSSVGDTNARWSAPSGNPSSGVGEDFSSTFATAPSGNQKVTVSAFPPYYDVDGDGSVTRADALDVTAAGSASPPLSEPGSGAGWQNQVNRFDVNDDKTVSVIGDFNLISNYLNRTGGGALPSLECLVVVDQPAVVTPTPPPPTTGGPFNPGPIRETE